MFPHLYKPYVLVLATNEPIPTTTIRTFKVSKLQMTYRTYIPKNPGHSIENLTITNTFFFSKFYYNLNVYAKILKMEQIKSFCFSCSYHTNLISRLLDKSLLLFIHMIRKLWIKVGEIPIILDSSCVGHSVDNEEKKPINDITQKTDINKLYFNKSHVALVDICEERPLYFH